MTPITFIMSMHYQPNVLLYITRLNYILDLESMLRRGNKAKVQLCCIIIQL